MEKRKILRAFSIVEALIVVTVLAIAIVASTPLITRKIAAIKDAGSTLGGSNHGRFEVFYKEIACFGSNCYEKKGPATSITVYERLDDATAKSICSVEPYYNPDYHAKATCYREYKAKPKTNRDGSITKAKIRDDSGSTIEIQKGGKYIFEPNITYSPGTYNPSTDKIFEPGDSDGAIKPDSGTNRVIEGFLTVHAGSYNGSNLWKFDGTDGNIPKVHPIPWETVYSGKKVIIDKPIPGVVVDGETRYIADFDAPEKASNIVFHAVGAGGAGGGLGGNGQNIYTLKDMTATDLTYIKNILKDRVQKICSDNHVICSNDVVRTGGNSEEEKFRTRGGEFGFGYSYNEPVKSDDDSVWPVFDSPWVFLNTETGNIVVKFDTRYDMIKPEELLDYTKELGASTQNSLVYDGPAWWSDWTPFNKFCVGGWTAGGYGGKGSDFGLTTYNNQYTKDNFDGATSNPSAYGGDYADNDATGYYTKWLVNKKFTSASKPQKQGNDECASTGQYNYLYTCSTNSNTDYFYVRHQRIKCQHPPADDAGTNYCMGASSNKLITNSDFENKASDTNASTKVARTNYECTRNYNAGEGGEPGENSLAAVVIIGQVAEKYVNPVPTDGTNQVLVSGKSGAQLDKGNGTCPYGYNVSVSAFKGGNGTNGSLELSSDANTAYAWTTGGKGSPPCIYCNKIKYFPSDDPFMLSCTPTATSTAPNSNACIAAAHAIAGEFAGLYNTYNTDSENLEADSQTSVSSSTSTEYGYNADSNKRLATAAPQCDGRDGYCTNYNVYGEISSELNIELESCDTRDYDYLYNDTLMKYMDYTVSGCAYIDEHWINSALDCGAERTCSKGVSGSNHNDINCNNDGGVTRIDSSTGYPIGIEDERGSTPTGLYNFVYHWIIPFSMNYLAYGEGGGAGEYATAKMSDTKSGSETKSIRIELGKPGVWDSTDNTVNSNTSWQGSTTGADGGDTTIDLVSADSTTKRILTAKGGKGGKGGKFTHRYDVGFAHEGNICSTPVYSNGVTTVDAPTGSIETSIDCLRGTELAKTTKNILAAAIEYSAMETIKSLSQSSSIIGIGLGKGAEGAGTTSNKEEYTGYRKLLNSSSSFGTEDSANTQLINTASTSLINGVSTVHSDSNNTTSNFKNSLLKPSELNFQGGGGAVIIVW